MRTTILGVTVLLLALNTSAQTTIYVAAGAVPPGNGSAASPFDDIQSAILAASSGDTVIVAGGTYHENVSFMGKDIRVVGTDGAAATIIDGDMAGPVVRFTGGETGQAVLEGFTLTNGLGGTTSGVYYGGLLFDGGRGQGGGIDIQDASPRIIGCRIVQNLGGPGQVVLPPFDLDAVGGRGGSGGIECEYASPLIEHCAIESNVAGPGGVALLAPFGSGGSGGAGGIGGLHYGLSVRNSTIRNNQGSPGASGTMHHGIGGSGGIGFHGTVLTVERCVIRQNHGATGENISGAGGIGLVAGSGNFRNSVIADNTSTSWGVGGVDVHFAAFSMAYCTVSNNAGGYGGVYVHDNFPASITNSIVWANQSVWFPTQAEIYCLSIDTELVVAFSDVKGGYAGTGMIDANPLFRSSVGGDYRLLAASPCIDAASVAAAPGITNDLDGNPRVIAGMADMGAYESCLIGTLEDFLLWSAIDGGGDLERCVKNAPIGSSVALYVTSPNGTLVGAPTIFAAELLPTNMQPAAIVGFPEIHLSIAPLILDISPLPPAGSLRGFIVPPGLGGFYARFQAFAVTPAAANGFFAATAAHELIF